MTAATMLSHADHVPRRTVRLRTVLGTLVLLALLPALGIATLAMWQSAQAYRHASATQLADAAQILAHSIEGDLSTRVAFLQAMAAGIGSGNMTLAQASQSLDSLGSVQGRLVLSNVDGSVPAGAQASALPAQVVRDAFARDGVSLSNLFERPGQGRPEVAFSIRLPVAVAQRAVLSLVLPVNELLQLAPQQRGADDSLLVAVTDGTGHLVARSRDAARFVGRPVPSWDVLKRLGTNHGQFQAVTTEGGGVIFSFETLANTPGWVVVIGEPMAVFDRGWRQPLAQLAIGSALCILAAWLVAAWLAHTIVRPVRALTRNAQAVAASQGEDLPPAATERPPALAIEEFESMRVSIEEAQLALQRRAEAERRNAQALATNELRYRTLAQTGAVVLWRGTPGAELNAVDGWEMLTGEPDAQALGMGWRRRLHQDDLPAMDTALRAIAEGARQMDVEFRIGRLDGSWCWVRGRGAAVPSADGSVKEWVGVLEDVSERHRAQARITHMALHDALTDLPNRVAFRTQLDAAIRRASRGDASAVLYIDLDRFKMVNDTLGHPAGDALLRAVSGRLQGLVREHDTVARLAGDEFAIVQSRVGSPTDAAELATRLVQVLSEPYDIQGQRVSIGASVGIMTIADDSCDADRLLKYADMALYRAKKEGRGRHSFFDPEMATSLQGRRRHERALRDALERGDFELRYEPVVNARERRISGVSATLHWQHPERGRLAASDFAPMAQELGLSGRLFEWLLNRVCQDLAHWPDCPKAALDLSAALPAGSAAICGWIAPALQGSGLDPRRLELEIDESALLAHPDAATTTVQALNVLGVQTSLVRFGASRTALGHLRRLPFGKLKLEHALLHDSATLPQSQALVRAMAQLCDELGIVMGAEGVDTDVQLAVFPERARVEVQGALFGGARAAADVPAVCLVQWAAA